MTNSDRSGTPLMGHDIRTLELARLYESQGYYAQAHTIYAHLHQSAPSREISAGLNRTEKRIDTAGRHQSGEKEVLTRTNPLSVPASLPEKLQDWVRLMVLEDQMGKLEKTVEQV